MISKAEAEGLLAYWAGWLRRSLGQPAESQASALIGAMKRLAVVPSTETDEEADRG